MYLLLPAYLLLVYPLLHADVPIVANISAVVGVSTFVRTHAIPGSLQLSIYLLLLTLLLLLSFSLLFLPTLFRPNDTSVLAAACWRPNCG
jgi:hypothetical protein